MICVYDTKDQAGEYSEIALSLFTQILEHKFEDKLLRLGKAMDVEYSKHLQPIIINTLSGVQAWNGGNAVDEEVAPVIRISQL